MSAGLTTYPRTDGNGSHSHIAVIRASLAALLTASAAGNAATAQTIITNLIAYAENTTNPPSLQETLTLAIDVRNALFAAQVDGRLTGNTYLLLAMKVCAKAWAQQNPIHTTGLNTRSTVSGLQLVQAKALLASAVTKADIDARSNDVRNAMEEIGMVGWLYEASALLGEDLGSTLMAGAQKYPDDPRFMGGRDHQNALCYLECGGAYNINVFIRINIPGCPEKLTLVGEAKGGASRYGTVSGPAKWFRNWNLKSGATLSQTDPVYAVSRAVYMMRSNHQSDSQKARREAGKLIYASYTNDQMLYLTTRTDASQKSTPEHFKCLT